MVKRIYDEDELIKPWFAYAGNKRKLMPYLMALIPPDGNRFVDLFGGTGCVGVNACVKLGYKELVYNDYEYDMAMAIDCLWRMRNRVSILDQTLQSVKRYYFGDAERFTEENKDRWIALRDDYNASLTPSFLLPYAIHPELAQARWDFRGSKLQLRGEDGKFDMVPMSDYAFDRHGRLKQCYLGFSLDDIAMASQVDFRLSSRPALLLFLLNNSITGNPRWTNSGLYNGQGTYNKILGDFSAILDYSRALSRIERISIYSCDATTALLPKVKASRMRSLAHLQLFRRTIDSLGPGDMVYIDPPYYGSNASYNARWSIRMEVFLLAFCEILDDKGVKFLLSNNLYYNDSIFREWSRHFRTWICNYKYTNASKGSKSKQNKCEVFVGNVKPPSRLPDGLIAVPRKADALEVFMQQMG